MGAYAPASIGPSGLIIPLYQSILNFLIQQYQAIYGSTVYLGPDSADYQMLAVIALAIATSNQGLQTIYLSMSPQTSTGPALDNNGRLIGTPRKSASFSTAVLTLTGTPATVINNGVVSDVNGNQWALPASVTIGGGGTAMATATCTTIGNITANPNTITIISKPTAGWVGATNTSAAAPGDPVEPDSQYRSRLLVSQAKPSLTLLPGTMAAVAAVPGVTRSVVYENPNGFTASFGLITGSGTSYTITLGYPLDSTDNLQSISIDGSTFSISSASGMSVTLSSSGPTVTNANFFVGSGTQLGPPHSITAVVENGASADIAQAIYSNRGIGCNTNGTTTVAVSDPKNPAISIPISFYILGYVPTYVALNVHPLTGFNSATQAAIQTGVANYLNSLGIGESVVWSELFGAALTARPDPDTPIFSIHSINSGPQEASTSGTLALGSPNVTVVSGTGIINGMTVVGTGVPDNTTVSSGGGTTSLVLSANATAGGTGVPLAFFTIGTSDINVAFNEAAQGSTVNVVVNLV